MKKAILFITLFCILFTSAVNVKAYDLSQDTVILKGKITKIVKTKKSVSITVKVTNKGKWNKNPYKMKLTKGEFADWVDEEGKVKKNQKVEMWLFTKGTKSIYDDEFIHIMKFRGCKYLTPMS